jgi:HNH endonuclease
LPEVERSEHRAGREGNVSRLDLALRIAELVGPEGLTIEDPADGWPARGTILVAGESIPVALYVAPIAFSHRSRDDVERRFQNPGQDRPIELVPGVEPIFVGLWEGDEPRIHAGPVLATADPNRRLGRLTRFSVFPRLESLLIAWATGIHIGHATTGEEIAAIVPALLPAHVHARVHGVKADEVRYRHELMVTTAEPPAERQRRISSTLARANGFARAVRDAYGRRCAMCEVGLDLIESAHILPVAAPGSVDDVQNGVALCANHHKAFDRHQICVAPNTFAIIIHPDVVQSATSLADQLFLTSTRNDLSLPRDAADRPDPAMFSARYRHFVEAYDWAG